MSAWQNADELPDAFDEPCAQCGSVIVGCIPQPYLGPRVVTLCAEGHVNCHRRLYYGVVTLFLESVSELAGGGS